jgi:hypothetical protein
MIDQPPNRGRAGVGSRGGFTQRSIYSSSPSSPPSAQHAFECLQSVVPLGSDFGYPPHRLIERLGSEPVADLPTVAFGGYETGIRERTKMLDDRLATDRHLLGEFRGACLTKL